MRNKHAMPHVPDLIRDPKTFDNGIVFERGLGRGKPDVFPKFQNEDLWNVSFSGNQTSVRVAANGGSEPILFSNLSMYFLKLRAV
ncbi:MAG: hypothetical protein ABJH45_00045 [Paracoccaceae bacterium]